MYALVAGLMLSALIWTILLSSKTLNKEDTDWFDRALVIIGITFWSMFFVNSLIDAIVQALKG